MGCSRKLFLIPKHIRGSSHNSNGIHKSSRPNLWCINSYCSNLVSNLHVQLF